MRERAFFHRGASAAALLLAALPADRLRGRPRRLRAANDAAGPFVNPSRSGGGGVVFASASRRSRRALMLRNALVPTAAHNRGAVSRNGAPSGHGRRSRTRTAPNGRYHCSERTDPSWRAPTVASAGSADRILSPAIETDGGRLNGGCGFDIAHDALRFRPRDWWNRGDSNPCAPVCFLGGGAPSPDAVPEMTTPPPRRAALFIGYRHHRSGRVGDASARRVR